MDTRTLSLQNSESASMQVSEMNFGLNMLRQVSASDSMVVSPVSVIFALAMVQLGARGHAKMQINRVIANGATDDAIVGFYSDLSKSITNSPGAQARIANGFFVNKTFPIKEDYSSMIAKKYGAVIKTYDFRQAAKTAKMIDNFVSENTNGKIKNIITKSAVRDAVALIVNAIYFKAKWYREFNKRFTTKAVFYHSPANEEKIKFMKEVAKKHLYAENEDVQVLSLSYKDTSYSFNIILPKKKFGLEEIRTKLDGGMIQDLLSRLKSTLLTIKIPKMKMEKNYDLKKALKAMGVSDLFDSNSADLSGVSKIGLYASDAKHRALIEVDEEGTTAAAATYFGFMRHKALRPRRPIPKMFIADHPFIFILTKDRNPLFIGQYV